MIARLSTITANEKLSRQIRKRIAKRGDELTDLEILVLTVRQMLSLRDEVEEIALNPLNAANTALAVLRGQEIAKLRSKFDALRRRSLQSERATCFALKMHWESIVGHPESLPEAIRQTEITCEILGDKTRIDGIAKLMRESPEMHLTFAKTISDLGVYSGTIERHQLLRSELQDRQKTLANIGEKTFPAVEDRADKKQQTSTKAGERLSIEDAPEGMVGLADAIRSLAGAVELFNAGIKLADSEDPKRLGSFVQKLFTIIHMLADVDSTFIDIMQSKTYQRLSQFARTSDREVGQFTASFPKFHGHDVMQ